ncbi:anti-sigma factor, partial [Pseudomonas syringae pv. tagetis]
GVSAAFGEDVSPVMAARGPWRRLGRLAVAAWVSVGVVGGVRVYNQDDIAGAHLAQQSQQPAYLTVPLVKGPAVLAC